MKFILDANMPYSAKKVFKAPDIGVHVRDIGLQDASDTEILDHASRERAIVVTRDLDFANLILHPMNTHAGVVVLRVPPYFTAGAIKRILKHFLSVVEKETVPGGITIVEPGRYRIRR